MVALAFQPSPAFQGDAFQGAGESVRNSGGFDSEAFSDVYLKFRKKYEDKLDVIPEKVIQAIESVAAEDTTTNVRELRLKSKMRALDIRFRRDWLTMANRLSEYLHEQQELEALEIRRKLKRRRDEEAILLLM